MNPLTQGVALGYKYYALSGHVFVRLNGSDAARGNEKTSLNCLNQDLQDE
jgi:hypothetical protein